MVVNTKEINPALESLFKNPNQVFFLDANVFIPPDRTKLGARDAVSFAVYKREFLIPLFECFSGLGIHEAVYGELVADSVKQFADQRKKDVPSKLCVYEESALNNAEKTLYHTYIAKISPHSQYDPVLHNSKDKGEVLSLAYMATRGYIYFGGNDNLPIRLVNRANELNTGLMNQYIVQSYELLYFLYKVGKYNAKGLRALYKYMYRLTKVENRDNPEWGEFVQQMDALYADCFL